MPKNGIITTNTNIMTTKLKNIDFFELDNFPLEILKRDPQPTFPKHSHQFFELVIVTKGSAIHKINDISSVIKVGDIFILKKNIEHEFCEKRNLSLINIIFDPSKLFPNNWETNDLPGFKALLYLEPEYLLAHSDKSRLRVIGRNFQKVLDLIDELERELQKKESGYQLVSKTIFMHLLYLLARAYTHSNSSHSMLLVKIANVINYIDQHFKENIKFDDLAKIAKMSIRNFQRTFKKANGISAQQYLLNKRLQHSLILLKNPNLQISEIAFKSGFSDSNYFSKQFKNKYKLSPKKFKA